MKSAAFVVGTNRKNGGGGLEKLSKCLTKTVAENLQMYDLKHNDNPQLQADVTEGGWEVIVARELLYHRSCYRDYTRPEKNKLYHNSIVMKTSMQSLHTLGFENRFVFPWVK